MEFRPIPCHESLRPFIRNYWLLTARCTATGTQQIFSNGAASLQFYLSEPVRLTPVLPGKSEDEQYRTVLFHQKMQKVGVICNAGDFIVLGAEFVPFCSRVFFKLPLQLERAGGEASSPEDMGDEGLAELARHIFAAESTKERVELLDAFFLARLAEFPEGDVNIERLGDVFDEVVPTDGSVARPPHCQDEFSPADLASTACLSQKQFTRVFNKYVGMNPKSYLRLLRFHKALQKLHDPAAATSSLKDIAASCGYCDLPHMIYDFRDICGYSPSELVSTVSALGSKSDALPRKALEHRSLGSRQELTEAFGQQFSGLMKKKIKIENLV